MTEQQASGLSITAWCFQQDITEQTFYYWRKRLATPPAGPQWVAVAPAGNAGRAEETLTLRIGRGAIEVTTGFDPRLLADVLSVLEGR